MRCPKCGYISFDHVDTCLKCNKNISKVSADVVGTTYNVAAPSFLRFPQGGSVEDTEADTEISFNGSQEDYDVIDPDLDVLVDSDTGDDEEMIDATISFGDELVGMGGDDGDDFEISLDDDDGGLDLGQFEDAFDEEQPSLNEEVALDLPDELSDISDLSAPGEDVAAKSAPAKGQELAADPMEGDFDLDLDLDQLGEEFSLTSDENESESIEDSLGDLSLDDLGLSMTEDKPKASPPKSVDPMDMDADLDFDLDLGGISLDEE